MHPAFLTIGEVARRAGVTVDTIRYYEKRGLLPEPARTASGYRQFPENVVRRIDLVRNARSFGFSLDQIVAFLSTRDRGGRPCHDVRAAAERLLEAVDRQIEELAAARRRIRRTLREWDKRLAATPPDNRAHLLEHLKHSVPGSAHGPLKRRR